MGRIRPGTVAGNPGGLRRRERSVKRLTGDSAGTAKVRNAGVQPEEYEKGGGRDASMGKSPF